jgi:folate-dependent phosphoribosylglycinamide formyltransferase PurN
VAVLCSHRAPGLVSLLNRDPRRGHDYEVVCCVSSGETFAEEVRVERRGVPCIPHAIRPFCAARGAALRDMDARVEYDLATLEILKPYNPDVLLLDGYLLLLTDPVLRRFEGRIVNVHHSDLHRRNLLGEPRYPGLHAVRDALFGGEPETRATAHIVTETLDDGPVLLRSWSFPVAPVARWAFDRGAADVLRACAWAHQEWMLREAWTPMLERAIELAGQAFDRPGAPLDVAALGEWVLEEDGTLAPAGLAAEAAGAPS